MALWFHVYVFVCLKARPLDCAILPAGVGCIFGDMDDTGITQKY